MYPKVNNADLATERGREKGAERTERDFRCPICRSAIGQASCLICALHYLRTVGPNTNFCDTGRGYKLALYLGDSSSG